MRKMMAIFQPENDMRNNQKSLDKEFRQILYLIKPYIQRINNKHYIDQYRLWLERLSDSEDEKLERNKILLELANQIHDGILKYPFTKQPPRGPLNPISLVKRPSNQVHPRIRTPSNVSQSNFVSNVPPVQHKKRPIKCKVLPRQQSADNTDIETSSWADMSDTMSSAVPSASTLACGDVDGQKDNDENKNVENKLSTLHELEGQKTQEFYAKQYEEETKHKRINVEPDEQVLALKSRIQDLDEVKKALLDTHCLTEDRKKILEKLQTKLVTVESQNAELRLVIDLQTKKMIELEMSRARIESEFKEEFTKLRNAEIESLKNKHLEEIKSLERTFKSKMEDSQRKVHIEIKVIEDSYEKKINELVKLHQASIKEKEDEISRLKIKSSSLSEEEIIQLKKTVSQMGKALRKSEKEHETQIDKMKQDYDIKKIAMELKIQTQKAELVVTNSATKQEEISGAINNLEVKYKNLLEAQKFQALDAQNNYEKVIMELKQILDDNQIPY